MTWISCGEEFWIEGSRTNSLETTRISSGEEFWIKWSRTVDLIWLFWFVGWSTMISFSSDVELWIKGSLKVDVIGLFWLKWFGFFRMLLMRSDIGLSSFSSLNNFCFTNFNKTIAIEEAGESFKSFLLSLSNFEKWLKSSERMSMNFADSSVSFFLFFCLKYFKMLRKHMKNV